MFLIQLVRSVPTDILLANGDELNLNQPKFALPFYSIFSSGILVHP